MNDAQLIEQMSETVRVAEFLQANIEPVRVVANALTALLQNGHRILLCGNGGSALDAQHFAAELVGHYRAARAPLAAMALSADIAIVTSIANDYNYATIFSRQVEAYGRPGDALIGISTSGRSGNVLAALETGQRLGLITIGMAGNDGGLMRDRCDLGLFLPFTETARIQEGQLMQIHLIAECIDAIFADPEGAIP